MSDQYYENLRDGTAGPLVEKYGMAITLTRHTPGTVDVREGTVGAGSIATYPCYGLVEEFDSHVVAASLVHVGEKKLLLSAKGLSVVPQIGDTFTLPDGVWSIPDGDGYNRLPPVAELAPGGVAVLYTIRIRK